MSVGPDVGRQVLLLLPGERARCSGQPVSLGSSYPASAAADIKDEAGRDHRYQIEAGVRGERLIILSTKLGSNEPVFTEIYPQFAQRDYLTRHCGVAFMQTWDGVDVLTKTILSLATLVESDEGSIADEHSELLDKVWERGFAEQNRSFPGSAG